VEEILSGRSATAKHPHFYQQAPVGIFVLIDFHYPGAALLSRSLIEKREHRQEKIGRGAEAAIDDTSRSMRSWFPAKIAALGTQWAGFGSPVMFL
jgi:hypothetical protein